MRTKKTNLSTNLTPETEQVIERFIATFKNVHGNILSCMIQKK